MPRRAGLTRCRNHRRCTGAASRLGGDSSPHASCAFGLEPEEAFKPIQRIGGSTGWYAANWFWRLRGLLDTSGAVSDCAVVDAIHKTCGMATPSTSGASNTLRRDV